MDLVAIVIVAGLVGIAWMVMAVRTRTLRSLSAALLARTVGSVVILRRDWRGAITCIAANPSATGLLGLTAGKPDESDYLNEELEGWPPELLVRLAQAREPFSEELAIPGHDRPLALQLMIQPVDHLRVVTLIDQTRDRSAQRLLSEREAHLRLVLETIFDGLVVMDEHSRILAVNSAMTRMFGYSPVELASQELTKLMPRAHDPESDKPRLLFDAERRMIGTSRMLEAIHKDGHAIPVEWSVCEGEQDGRRIYVGVVHDLSEQVRAQQEVRRVSDLLRQVIDAAPDIITLKDEQLRYLLVNTSARKLFGRDAVEVIGKRSHDLVIDPADAQRIEHEDVEVLKTGRELDTERQLTLADNQVRWVRAQKRRVSITGSGTCVLSVNADITPLKAAVAAAESARSELEEVHRAQSAFLAGIGHEIRTPLSGMIGLAELLSKSELSSEQEEYVRTLHRAGDALLVLLNDLLDYSKIESGKLEFEQIPYDLGTVIHDIVELFRPRVTSGTVDLVVDVQPGLPRQVIGDPGRLRQIITNLVSNAVKFTRAGHVVVEVRGGGTYPDGRSRYQIAIIDTGMGIDEQRLSRLFKPFQQADASVARRYGGTGLGLAISHKLIGLMDGTITVTSQAGIGSRFQIELPLGLASAEKIPNPAVKSMPIGTRVLVVDDHDLTRRILGDILREVGCDVVGAAGAGEAIGELAMAKAMGTPFTIALIDDSLPGMNGSEMAQVIREDPTLLDTKLVLITSNPQRGDAARCARIGFSGYLVKPVRGELLITALIQVLGSDNGLVTRHSVSESKIRKAVVERAPLPPMQVLVVEDNPVNQRVMDAMLTHLGVTVALASDGRAALERMSEHRFDVVLLDCHLPIMDGYQVATELRRRERNAGTDDHQVLVALTGNASEEDRQRCLDAGMDDHLVKPASEEQIYAKLSAWIRHD